MQVVFDEHISPRIVKALKDTVRLPVGFELVSIYSLDLTSTEDETWLEKYAAAGEYFFVSGDRRMLSRPTLLQIVKENGLIGFYLRKEFASQTRIRQLAYAAYWWEPIQECFNSPLHGSAWIVPNEYSDAKLKKVDIDGAIKGLAAIAK